VPRRFGQLVVFLVVVLVPVLAWAGNCLDGGGSDTGRFQEILTRHGAAVAVLASFGFGFLASLTPCVYPMVPVTVSIFGATQTKSRLRGAALSGAFVLGIATLFTPMGVVSALSGKLMGSALSNAWVILGLVFLFVALSASMFGAFELALPSSLTNKLSGVGGVGFRGAFVMGLVMGLIAAPCTGPFLTGMVTVIATTKSVALGSAALFAFALGLGVLFFVAGAFTVNLPKGGAWMMGIKWVSGVGLAYMAFAYLRDRFVPVHRLVDHPGYAFGGVALGVLLVGAGLGAVHILAERRRSPIARLSRPMKLASIVPAVAGAAMLFSWLHLNHDVVADDPNAPMIAWQRSEREAVALAAAEGKPLLIDFGASWCIACGEIDTHTFPDPKVRAEARRFVPLKVDLSDDDEEAQRVRAKYGVTALPVVLLVDARGNQLVRFNEPVTAEKLYTAMKCNAPTKREVIGLR
jgi:thioredoxin:protein disulfide reductase